MTIQQYHFEDKKYPEFWYRPDTSDEKEIQEVMIKQVYKHRFLKDGRVFDVEPGEKWLDIGASIGTFAVWAGSKGCHVLACEPENEMFFMLQKNTVYGGLPIVTYKTAVVGDSRHEALLSLGKKGSEWRHSLVKKKSDIVQNVPAVNFNKVLTPDIDGVKMDIEGAEYDIIMNCTNWKNVKKLVFEYHFDSEPILREFYALKKQLETFGFEVYHRKLGHPDETYKFFPPATIIYCFREGVN